MFISSHLNAIFIYSRVFGYKVEWTSRPYCFTADFKNILMPISDTSQQHQGYYYGHMSQLVLVLYAGVIFEETQIFTGSKRLIFTVVPMGLFSS